VSRAGWGVRLRRRWLRLARRSSGLRALWLITVLTLAISALIASYPRLWPISMLAFPLVLASLWVDPRRLPWFVVFLLAVVAALVPAEGKMINFRAIVGIVTIFLLGLVILLTAFRRTRLGVAGVIGESMLVDLRDRIQSQGELPALPRGWYAEKALRSAGGTKFAGDFMVASTSTDGRRLDVAVVDVSGKGIQAGTRSLLLSGAFGGLLAAVPPARFMSAANDYLLRQGWLEGFATAVQLSLNLDDGSFEIRTAGHPPAVQLNSGAGRWKVLASEGPVLGILEDAEFTPVRGTMRPGDAVLLYTDGLVETRDREIGLGIDKLLGQGERLLRAGFDTGAARLIDKLGSDNDDRALLLVHRRR